MNQLILLSLVLFSFFSLALGFFTIVKDYKSLSSRLWFATSIFATAWSSSLYLNLVSDSAEASFFYGKLLHSTSIFIPVFFYHFTVVFLYRAVTGYRRAIVAFGYLAVIILSAITFLTNFIISGVDINAGFSGWIVAGEFYYLFLAVFWLYSVVSFLNLVKGYFRFDGVLRRKIFYLLLASLIGFLGGGTSFLPQTFGAYPYGIFISWLYPLLVTYGIFVDEIKIKIRI